MKKQTAVEWLVESLEKLEYNLEKGIISLDDYIINVKWVKDQAKAMEKDIQERDIRFAYMAGFNRYLNDPPYHYHLEEYIEYIKSLES